MQIPFHCTRCNLKLATVPVKVIFMGISALRSREEQERSNTHCLLISSTSWRIWWWVMEALKPTYLLISHFENTLTSHRREAVQKVSSAVGSPSLQLSSFSLLDVFALVRWCMCHRMIIECHHCKEIVSWNGKQRQLSPLDHLSTD